MKFSYKWLKDLSGFKGEAEKLSEILSSHAFETEVFSGIEFENIIVAKVVSIEKHPNADKLRLVQLTDGTEAIGPVVCGAKNFDVGDLVPLALPGALIPFSLKDGKSFHLAKAVIRGIESKGMICSGKELGLSDESEGILRLPKKYKAGETFATKNQEDLLEISIPANRSDLLGYQGVAFEISALTGSSLKIYKPTISLSKVKAKSLRVKIKNSSLCPLYLAVRLSHIKVSPSPAFIQNRLKQSGHRVINNVVDITNYVMLEAGQPLHAFDAAFVKGAISVRNANANEKLLTLDGVMRTLSTDHLVIADDEKALGVAGVLGGAESMIREKTKEIILEAANFNGSSIRKTSKDLGVRTDAVIRFEKSLPPKLPFEAAAYAVDLLIKYAGAKVEEFAQAGPKPPIPPKIKFDSKKINAFLGTDIKETEQKSILNKFGFETKNLGKLVQATVPFKRTDISIWQDLAEEIVRFKGFESIKPSPPDLKSSLQMTDPIIDIRQKICEILARLGFYEIYTYSFVSEKDLETFNIQRSMALALSNPLSAEAGFLRPSLLPNMVKVAQENRKYFENGNYFEIGNVFFKHSGQIIQKNILGLLSFDKEYPSIRLSSAIMELCLNLNVDVSIEQNKENTQIKVKNEVIGEFDQFRTSKLELVYASLDLEFLKKYIQPKLFKPVIKYPSRELDIAVWGDQSLRWSQILQVISRVHSNLIRKVELFDIYKKPNQNKKSLAFRITYQSHEKTLTDKEVLSVHEKILKHLREDLKLEIR